MDNQINSSDSTWIDSRLAILAAPDNWHPDPRRAFAQFKIRQDQPRAAASARWIQFSMAAAVLASIGLVVALLPWRVLLEGKKAGTNLPTEPAKAAPPPEAVTKPTPAPAPPGPPLRVEVPAVAAVQQPAQPSAEQEPKPPEKLGPGVTAPRVIPPMAEPVYSDDARLARVQGTVMLDVIVRADGTGKVVGIVRSLGYGLDEKAVEAFEKWRFTPGMKDGKFVDVQLEVTINFKLY